MRTGGVSETLSVNDGGVTMADDNLDQVRTMTIGELLDLLDSPVDKVNLKEMAAIFILLFSRISNYVSRLELKQEGIR